MTAPTATDLARAREALERQLESTREHGSLTWSEADWMLDAHGDTILAALDAAGQAAPKPERPLRYTMRGDAARTVVLLYAAGDGNDLHGELAAELRPPFAGSGGGPTPDEWHRFVEALVGAWNDAGFSESVTEARIQQAVAAEREACAKAPVGGSNPPPGLVHKDDPFSAYNRGWADGVRDLRAAIRARAKGGES